MSKTKVLKALAIALERWGYDGRYYHVDYGANVVICYEINNDSHSNDFGELISIGVVQIG